ncbi:MAG: efflux RND transporter periplasmic adaptor subunit [bacterium]|nr:efflux RND transporter periplasmic adaptor subunit [bacterium]
MAKLLSKKYIFVVIAIIVIISGSFIYFKGKGKPKYNFVLAKNGTLFQEVSVSGKIKPAQSLDLGFEISGKVSSVYKKIGDKVSAGERIIALDNSQTLAELNQAKANLEAEKSRLEELKKGTRPEELQMAETKAEGLEKALVEASLNQQTVKDKALADLDNAYSSALTSLQKAASSAKTSLLSLTDIQYNHFIQNDDLAGAKAKAVLALLGAENAGKWTSQALNDLDGGAFSLVQKAVLSQAQADIDSALSETKQALQKTKDSLDAVPFSNELTSTEKTNLSAEKTSILSEIAIVAGKEQTILVQKSTNAYNLAAAGASLTAAQNSLDLALDDLALKQAGATLEQISAQEAREESAGAAVENIRTRLAKNILFSPIAGIVTKREIEIGESVVPGTAVVSLISASGFEIEAKVPEVDIAKIKIGDSAKVTLDAYGSDLIFEAKVAKIDPAETMVEGLPTYKVNLQFLEDDGRLRSGMTADVEILTAEKQGVILIPQRAIISTNGDKLVRVLGKGNEVKEVKVKTGLRGSNGEIEIVEGLSEGDKVITSMPEK